MNKICGIYRIESPSGRIYIGQSQDCNKRWNQYYKKLNCKRQHLLYKSFKKYGFNAHVFSIIEECSKEQLNNRERHWQEHYDVLNRDRGMNLRYVESDDKIAEFSLEVRQKISKNRKGIPLSKEHKELLRKANMGRVISEETRNKISRANKGKTGVVHTKEFKEKMSSLKMGKKLSDKTKNKMSEAHTGRKCVTNRQILCIEDNLTFNSLKICAEYYGISHTPIWLNANNKQKKVKSINKTFKYADIN